MSDILDAMRATRTKYDEIYPTCAASVWPTVPNYILHHFRAAAYLTRDHYTSSLDPHLADIFECMTNLANQIYNLAGKIDWLKIMMYHMVLLVIISIYLTIFPPGLEATKNMGKDNTDKTREITKTARNVDKIPPHAVLLRYIHPSTSLWPEGYLRAFDIASRSDSGRIRLSVKMVVDDLLSVKVILRQVGGKSMFDEWIEG